MTSPTLNLGDATRQQYWSTFDARVAAGTSMPLVLPYSVLGIFVVPALWLAIPHRRRPWVYASRWPVLAACLAFNVHVLLVTSSWSFAYGYASGLMAFWGCVVCCNWLVWTRPQFDLARVMRRRKRKGMGNGTVQRVAGSGGEAWPGEANGIVASGFEAPAQNGNGAASAAMSRKAFSNGGGVGGIHIPKSVVSGLQDTDFEYYWQPYPEDEPFSTRLDWIVDLLTSFRGAGWNWAISSIPNPPFPSDPRIETTVNPATSIPLSTASGYRICQTQGQFLRLKLRSIALSYAALDFLAVNMMKDPYFILGPEHDYPLPAYLASLGPLSLYFYRAVFVLAGVFTALQLIFSANDLVQYYLVARLLPGGRAELWHHASIFGGFVPGVLDRGLAGFWGVWWHQTFRFGFKAPTDWLLASYPNLLDRRAARVVAALVAFTLSGLLHACGSFSSVPHTSPWRPPLFFLLQFAGVVGQVAGTAAYADRLAGLPRWVRRAGNAVFVAGWLLLTAKPFMDDLATAGIWLLEPVPVSPLRWLGYGQPGDSWWRWDTGLFSHWHVGKYWWQSGLAI